MRSQTWRRLLLLVLKEQQAKDQSAEIPANKCLSGTSREFLTVTEKAKLCAKMRVSVSILQRSDMRISDSRAHDPAASLRSFPGWVR
jgi:hypothetical protein